MEDAKNLQNRRRKAGLSTQELADHVGISRRTLEDYEMGRKPISNAKYKTVYLLAKVLDCSTDDLVDPNGLDN